MKDSPYTLILKQEVQVISDVSKDAVNVLSAKLVKGLKAIASSANFDITLQGRVTAILPNNKYEILIDGVSHQVPIITGGTCKINDTVRVVLGGNDWSKAYVLTTASSGSSDNVDFNHAISACNTAAASANTARDNTLSVVQSATNAANLAQVNATAAQEATQECIVQTTNTLAVIQNAVAATQQLSVALRNVNTAINNCAEITDGCSNVIGEATNAIININAKILEATQLINELSNSISKSNEQTILCKAETNSAVAATAICVTETEKATTAFQKVDTIYPLLVGAKDCAEAAASACATQLANMAATYATKAFVEGLGTVYVVPAGADLSGFNDNDLILELDAE